MQIWSYNMTTKPTITTPKFLVEEDDRFLLFYSNLLFFSYLTYGLCLLFLVIRLHNYGIFEGCGLLATLRT